jgi:hypothetical protein
VCIDTGPAAAPLVREILQRVLNEGDRRNRAPRDRASYPEAGGKVESALHWDLVRDLRAAGEVYADGQLVYRDGRFLYDLL